MLEVVDKTVLLADEDDVATKVIMVVGVTLGVTEKEVDDTGGSTTGVTEGGVGWLGGSTTGVTEAGVGWIGCTGTAAGVDDGAGLGDGVLEELGDGLCPPTGDPPPDPPEQRPEVDGFEKT